MRLTRWAMAAVVAALAAVLVSTTHAEEPKTLKYPDTKTGDVTDDYHGTKVADPYRWLEDDVRKSKDVAAWVEAENKVTFGYLEGIPERDQNLGTASDGGLEPIERLFALALEFDRHEHRHRQPDLFLIEQRGIAPNDAGFFQEAQTAQTWTRGQPHAIGEFGGGQAAVLLQLSQQPPVDGIQGKRG